MLKVKTLGMFSTCQNSATLERRLSLRRPPQSLAPSEFRGARSHARARQPDRRGGDAIRRALAGFISSHGSSPNRANARAKRERERERKRGTRKKQRVDIFPSKKGKPVDITTALAYHQLACKQGTLCTIFVFRNLGMSR